jgi:antitoxin MazE
MEVQIKEWGNSQGIRLPKSVLQEAGIALGEKLTVEVEKGKIVLSRSFRHKTLEERIRESGCELSGIGELDWGEPQGNEVW